MADGNLAGSVIDIRNNQPISGATITATPEGGGQEHKASSNDNGEWGPLAVPAGICDMTIQASGYAEGIYPGIYVIENNTTALPLALHPADWDS